MYSRKGSRGRDGQGLRAVGQPALFGQQSSLRQAELLLQWVSLKADPERRMWVQVVYLRGDAGTLREQRCENR